jgi:hypothetical protein
MLAAFKIILIFFGLYSPPDAVFVLMSLAAKD